MAGFRTILGPMASWIQEDDDPIFQYAFEEAKLALRRQLERRLSNLEDSSTVDDLLLEIRRQIADCAVDGRITEAADLQELALALVEAYHQRKRM